MGDNAPAYVGRRQALMQIVMFDWKYKMVLLEYVSCSDPLCNPEMDHAQSLQLNMSCPKLLLMYASRIKHIAVQNLQSNWLLK